MTDQYTPANWSQGYGWGQGAPGMYTVAPTTMPSPSTMPAYGSAAVTAANAGVAPGSQAQETLQNASPPIAPYGTPPAAPQQQPNQLSPQQLQLLRYFMGNQGRGGGQGTQQMLMQMLMQRAQGQQGGMPNLGGGNLNNPFLQAILQQHFAPPQAQVPQ